MMYSHIIIMDNKSTNYFEAIFEPVDKVILVISGRIE